jgi:hypothetical protein
VIRIGGQYESRKRTDGMNHRGTDTRRGQMRMNHPPRRVNSGQAQNTEDTEQQEGRAGRAHGYNHAYIIEQVVAQFQGGFVRTKYEGRNGPGDTETRRLGDCLQVRITKDEGRKGGKENSPLPSPPRPTTAGPRHGESGDPSRGGHRKIHTHAVRLET